ncbi:cyclic AMP phosphodiesterase [Methylococcus capsulatus str. Bath]|jgi:Icc protein|uniref:Cyclic AMP phosphodiesterase n=1 Tax=Methylococcus capsulatus (strain ATCC 33009 / NCIMB 11132 / Bath) TaxID=243233 RepID=Q606D3_METCA|nr:3',5'-cyclic-AMP phosphodiesterase [Methylococcus capsulatus]AAU91930.1 cyclic AMP phosphodiesterase [Methylococcus capsulatus str. Bath]
MPDSGTLCLLQLTDSHILPDAESRFYGSDSAASLGAVIDHANQRRFDLVLFTGDLAQEPVPQSYRRLAGICAALPAPCHWLPGNHDEPALARHVLESTPLLHQPVIRRGRWLIVCLDSTVPGSAGGSLSTGQFDLLERTLSRHPSLHTLVALHHHPVPSGSAWMDTMILDNAGEFFAVLRRHPQVKAVVHGHTHQVADVEIEGTRVLGTPSTCIQFRPASQTFALDAERPGYRWLELGPDGSVATGICRVAVPPASDTA